ncbi:MAG: polyprenyl synthetase family protein [Gammaproteobacteria bacterium]|nr:polyprenyl synthetase family protein [Gammaproteobacteria bacterium]MCW5584470.1 polyprenyl synthetase family protein [Gammaproteobacteria bacterium]
MTLNELFELCSNRLEKLLPVYLRDIPSLDLKTAMEYTLLNGGKHIRPLLIYATGSMFAAPLENLDIPASSVELIHTYSLIHDDLPCMDNADLRRGKPTSHKVYGEGMAILTGDALHTLAMQIIATHPSPLTIDKRLRMIAALSQACGPYGMAAGQALDIIVMNDDTISEDLLLNIYQLKTGALLSACIELGRLASKDDDEIHQRALKEFGNYIGLAFQIQDDILDIEATSEALGKHQGTDAKNKKITYPKLVGMTTAKEKVQSLYQQALEAINFMGHQAQILRELVEYMLERGR